MAAFERCPLCGTSVKADNLGRHIHRVHPKAEARSYVDEAHLLRRRPPSALDRRIRGRRLLVSVAVIALVGVSLALYGLSLQKPTGPLPHLQVSPEAYDFGEIPPETVSTSFTLANTGQSNLVLMSIMTSCMCTSAVLRVRGRESPTFGAHGNPSGWSETLAPGESGNLTVTYDPNLHPDEGFVTRAVYITSNDPNRREVQITLTFYVVRS